MTTSRAAVVNRSNIKLPSIPSGQRPACFLCTACLLTSSASAISCHDQPCRRALPTWSDLEGLQQLAQRDHGPQAHPRTSVLPAASARSVASVMPSTIVDRPGSPSTHVDSAGELDLGHAGQTTSPSVVAVVHLGVAAAPGDHPHGASGTVTTNATANDTASDTPEEPTGQAGVQGTRHGDDHRVVEPVP